MTSQTMNGSTLDAPLARIASGWRIRYTGGHFHVIRRTRDKTNMLLIAASTKDTAEALSEYKRLSEGNRPGEMKV